MNKNRTQEGKHTVSGERQRAPKAPFKKLDQAFVARAGFPVAIGTRVVVTSIVNSGTKRAPLWRICGDGMWFYAEDLSATPVL